MERYKPDVPIDYLLFSLSSIFTLGDDRNACFSSSAFPATLIRYIYNRGNCKVGVQECTGLNGRITRANMPVTER